MNWLSLPWAELSVAAPLAGAVLVQLFRAPASDDRIAVAATLFALVAAGFAWAAVLTGAPAPEFGLLPLFEGRPLLTVDRLSGPLLPLVALLHVLTVFSTARVKRNRMSYTGHLVGAAIRLATFACVEPWPLVVLLSLNVVPPLVELSARKKPSRVFALHMALFVAILVGGWTTVANGDSALGGVLVLAAVLIRSGTVPAHLWVGDLFDRASFGTAMLFVASISGVYAAIRLALPVAPEWALQTVTWVSLFTTVYTAGLATVQRDARRFFAYLFLSHASLVLVGLELHTVVSLTGALALWLSVPISLGGLGLIMRAAEARHGRMTLDRHHGLYEQTPALAVGFLLTGLGSVGFPGTAGFVASELLVDGAITANIFVGIGLTLAALLNGIAILRVYFLLFTGARRETAVPLAITWRERLTLLTLSGLILGAGIAPQYLLADRSEAARAVERTLPDRTE